MSRSLTVLSIAANALFGGSIFIFPLLAPALLAAGITQTQLTTIVLAGMGGQYPLSSLVGAITDRYGPRACSLAASILFSISLTLFSRALARGPSDSVNPSCSFHLLVFYFCLAGLGTVFSYFSSLFAASRNFPRYLGVASGVTTALFGLSPLVLSLIASSFFDKGNGLDVPRFLQFLGLTVGFVHLIGALTLSVPSVEEETICVSPTVDDERTSLLPRPSQDFPKRDSALDLLRDSHFWVLAIFLLIVLGTSEMVLSNIGTMVLSLPNSTVSSGADYTSKQVRLLSLSNTISRLLIGPFADLVSPTAVALRTGTVKTRWISRIAFLFVSSALVLISSLWMLFRVQSQNDLWIFSVGIGAAYGTAFTVLPSIMSSVWGLTNLARNYGIATYAPFIGTPFFSYTYALVSSHHTVGDPDSACRGRACWETTFWVTTVSSFLAILCSLLLWRRWMGKL